jgi:hypothetical protein
MKYLEQSLEFQKVRLKSGVTGWICDVLRPGVAYILETWEPYNPDGEYQQEIINHSDIECLLIEIEVPFNISVVLPTGEFEERREEIHRELQQQEQAYKQQYQSKSAAVA